MRVTPNTIVSPAAMMNSDDAEASPFSACTKRKERSGTRWPRYRIVIPGLVPGLQPSRSARAAARWIPGTSPGMTPSLLAHRLHLVLGEQVLGAVLVFPALHGALLVFERRLAHPGAQRRLVIERAHHHRPGNRLGLQAVEGGEQLVRGRRACLVGDVFSHVTQ